MCIQVKPLLICSKLINNQGQTKDTYQITASGGNWTYTVIDMAERKETTSISVGAGANALFSIDVEAPSSGITNNQVDYANIVVASQNVSTVNQQQAISTTVQTHAFDLLKLTNNTEGTLGQTCKYSFQIANTGPNEDTYQLSLTGEQKWPYEIKDKSNATIISAITIAPSQSKKFNVNVTIPTTGLTNGETDTVNMVAVSQDNSSVTKQVEIITTSPFYDVSIIPPTSFPIVVNGQTTHFFVEIKNTGMHLDKYEASVIDSGNWTYEIRDNKDSGPLTSLQIMGGSIDTFIVKATVPYDLPIGTTDYVTIKIDSLVSPLSTDTLQITTQIPTFDMSITQIPTQAIVAPSHTFNYSVHIKNKCIINDAYTITTSGGNWSYTLRNKTNTANLNTISVDGNLSETFILQVGLPDIGSLTNGQTDTVNIHATSMGNSRVSNAWPITTASATYAFQVTPTTDNDYVYPGKPFLHQMAITNTGHAPDSYQLSLSGSKWVSVLRDINDTSDLSTISVAPGETKYFGIQVTAPQSHLISNGESDAVTLNVVSLSRAEVQGTTQVSSRSRTYSLTMQTLSNHVSLRAGQFYNYTIMFTNTGTADDTYNLSTNGGNWIYALRNMTDDANLSMISIPAGASKQCILKTTMPKTGVPNGGSDTVTIHAVSQGRATISFDYQVTTNRPTFLYKVTQLTPVTPAWPGQIKNYLFEIENTGLLNDTYNISASGNWTYAIRNAFNTGEIRSISVASGMTETCILKVIVPDSTVFSNGASDIATITLVSQGNPSATTSIDMEQTSYTFSFDIQNITAPRLVYPGQTFNYNLQINNTGLSLDSYNLSLFGGDWTYTIRNLADTSQIKSISANPSSNAVFNVKVTVPKTGIANGQSDTVTVQVTSQARHDVIETIQVQTTTPTFYYSLQSSTQDMAVDLGNSYNFRIQINNHGLNDDTYRISLDGGNWDYVIRNDLDNANINAISVDGQKTGVFVVKVSVPLTGVTRGEAETITINTVSQGNAEASKNIQITTSTPIYSFDLTQATDNAFVYPGQTFFYQMKIGNTGSYTDTYNLSLEPGSWAYAIRDKSDIANITELSVGGGVTDTFLIKTKVPRTIGENDACTITVVSQGNTTSKETISVISTISTFAFNMTANAYTSIVLPGESVNYSIQINNTSTAADTFNLSLSGGNFNYWIRNATDTANITRMLVYGGQTGTFLVKVKALNSDQIANGTHDSVTINAVSQGNKTLSDAIQLTSTTPTYAFSLQNSSGNAVAFADDIKDYIVTIQNTGSYIDTYNLSLSGGNWHRMIRNADDNAMIDSITLDKQSTGSFIIRQFVPSSAELANGETESITISAISQGRSQISHAVLITTTIPTFSFALTNVTHHATVHPGQYVLYPIEIKNDGATMDSYDLSISEDVWPCVFRNASDTATISSISLDAGYTALFWLKVSVPITGVSSGQSDTATVMVTSKGSATVNRSAQMTTATPVFGFNMANLSNNLQIYPGETAHYTFCITNTSLTDDTFLLNVSGSQFQSEISNAEDTANIDAISVNHGSTDTFIVKVIVPKAGVDNGVSDTITVSAISLGNKSLVTQIQATTTIPSFSFTVQALTNNVLGSIGESYYFPIEVKNTGATLDTYNLSLSSSTWEHAIRNESDTATIDTLSVRSGYTALLFVKVNVPSTGVSNNQQDSVLLEITSQGNQTVQSASVQLTTTTHLVAFHMQAITDNSVVYPGKSYGYAIQLSNNGSFNDTYDLSTTSANFSYTIRDQFNGAKITEISVDAGSTETFYVNVDVPYTNLSNGDDDTVLIQCVSQNNSGMSQSISLTTTIPTFNFVLSKTSPDATIYPGQSFNYRVSLTNVCAWSDTFDLTISGGAWNYQIRDVSDTKNIGSLSVGPGLSKTFLIKVSVPYTGVANGASESIEISAVSQGHYQVSQTDQITTTTPTISFTVQNLTGNSEIQTGQKFYYDYQVQNTGTAMDTYDLFVSGGNWNYTIRNAGDFGTINHITANAGESVRFFVCVTAPQGTSNGATDSIEVTTISHGNPSVQNIISTTSTTPVVSQSVMFSMPDGSQETDEETSQQYMMGTKIETVDAENQEPPLIYGTRTTNTLDASSGNTSTGSGYALSFDGTDDNVNLGTNLGNHFSGGSAITIEYWFKGSVFQSPVRFQDSPNTTNFIVAGWNTTQTNPMNIINTDGAADGVSCGDHNYITDGRWHHLAMTWQRNTTLGFKSYLDGVLVEQRDSADVGLPPFTNESAFLGAYGNTGEFIKGQLDEVRIWDVVRSQSEIQQNMCQKLAGNESGLFAYYRFDHIDGSTLSDLTGNGNNGTLLNMDNNDWVVSSAPIGDTSNSSYLNTGQGYALSFDGVDETVNVGTAIANYFSGRSAITIEYWFKGSTFQSPVRIQDASGQYLVAGWSSSAPIHIISSDGGISGVSCGDVNTITDGNWHHLAMTWQQNTTNGFKSYLDGVLVAQRDSANVTLPVLTNDRTFLGSFGTTGEYINGQLDEVRIWDVVRTQSQIQRAMYQTLKGNETGLYAYYLEFVPVF
jgi:uncharacterized membrane protein